MIETKTIVSDDYTLIVCGSRDLPEWAVNNGQTYTVTAISADEWIVDEVPG